MTYGPRVIGGATLYHHHCVKCGEETIHGRNGCTRCGTSIWTQPSELRASDKRNIESMTLHGNARRAKGTQ